MLRKLSKGKVFVRMTLPNVFFGSIGAIYHNKHIFRKTFELNLQPLKVLVKKKIKMTKKMCKFEKENIVIFDL